MHDQAAVNGARLRLGELIPARRLNRAASRGKYAKQTQVRAPQISKLLMLNLASGIPRAEPGFKAGLLSPCICQLRAPRNVKRDLALVIYLKFTQQISEEAGFRISGDEREQR